MARRRSRGRYKLTPKRRVALKKAQMISARKRKAAPNKKVFGAPNKSASGFTKRPALSTKAKIGITAGVVGAAVVGAAVYRHKASGSSLHIGLHKRVNEGELVAHQVYKGPLTFDEHGFRTGGGTVSEMRTFVSPSEFKITRRGITMKRRGGRSLDIEYRHRPLTHIFGMRIASGGAPPQAKGRHGRKIEPMTQAQRDAIPHYFPHTGGAKTPGWPININAETARLQNVGLREGTHEKGPQSVRRITRSTKKQKKRRDPRQRAMDDPIIARFLGEATKRARTL